MFLPYKKARQCLTVALLLQGCSNAIPLPTSAHEELFYLEEKKGFAYQLADEEEEVIELYPGEENGLEKTILHTKRKEHENVQEENKTTKRVKLSFVAPLPREVWKSVLSYLPSAKLHRYREVNSLFNAHVKEILRIRLEQELAHKDINAIDKEGQTLLHRDARQGDILSCQLLIDKGADVNAKVKYHEYTPIYLAVQNGHLPIVRLLIDKGVDVHGRDKYGNTLLYTAAKQKDIDIEMIKFLLEKDVDINTKDVYGTTALHYTAENGNLAALRLLLDNGADLHDKDKYGYTLLHKAVMGKNIEMVRFLLDNGADVNAQDSCFLDTPLHLAKGEQEIVYLLIVSGANLLLKNKKKYTPLSGQTPFFLNEVNKWKANKNN